MKINIKRSRIKIYISGAMTSLTPKQYKENFQRAEDFLKNSLKKDYEKIDIINPTKKAFNVEDGFDYEDVMHINFACIDVCDAIAMIPGWEASKGANRELRYAESKMKHVFILKPDQKTNIIQPNKKEIIR